MENMVVFSMIAVFIRLLNQIDNSWLDITTICKERPAESVTGEKVMMPALVSSDLLTEWKASKNVSDYSCRSCLSGTVIVSDEDDKKN